MAKFKKGPKCPVCRGKGYDYWDKEAGVEDAECQECFGTGIQASETADNHIPINLKLGRDEE